MLHLGGCVGGGQVPEGGAGSRGAGPRGRQVPGGGAGPRGALDQPGVSRTII